MAFNAETDFKALRMRVEGLERKLESLERRGKQAEQKMEQTRQNLLRIGDIVNAGASPAADLERKGLRLAG